MNVAEDLSGLSRAELVYKAKLAEQAERCVRAASRFHFGFSTVCASRRGRRTAKNLSGAPGSGRSRIGSGFGGTERATADARDDPRGVREPVSGGASDRAARAPRPDLARDHAVSSRIAASSTRTATPARARRPGTNSGATARLARAATSRLRRAATSRRVQPRRASASPGRLTPRGDAPSDPLDWARRAHQSTRVVRRRTVWCRLRRSGAFFSFFFFGYTRTDEPTAPPADPASIPFFFFSSLHAATTR